MYSYEERLRAVKLYIKLGKRVLATIRESGYPTKNALKGGTENTNVCRTCRYGLDLSRFSAAPSARLSHLSFESDGACPAQC